MLALDTLPHYGVEDRGDDDDDDIGVNTTAFGRKLTLFQRHPAFPLFTQKVPLFLRISSLTKIDDITIYVA